MLINTRIFGEVEIADEKIICMENGIIGFPDLKHFALIHNSERSDARMTWMVSVEEPEFALPVMDPLMVCPSYNPVVEDEMLRPIGELDPEELLVLVTITVPKDVTKMTVNLKAPVIINAKDCRACQLIVEGDEYPVKFPVYDILQSLKGKEDK